MPIRGLEQFLLFNSTQKLPLQVVEDTTVALDGFWFLKKYMPLLGQEPVLDFLPVLQAALAPLEKLVEHTQLVWIWDGIEYTRSVLGRTNSLQRTREVFSVLSERTPVHGFFDQELFVEPATSILRNYGITVIRAPYSAVAQCVYFLRERCVKYIFTKTDALYFRNGTKIITDFRFSTNSLSLIDRHDFFTQTGFNLRGFQSFAFLSGCELCPTVPSYADNFTMLGVSSLVRNRNIEEHLKDYFNKKNTADAKFEESEEAFYLKLYYGSFICAEYHPVMTLVGRVECLNTDNVPSDLDTLFGRVLDDILYQELFRCNISSFLPNKLAWTSFFTDKQASKNLLAFKKVLSPNFNLRSQSISDMVIKLLGLNVSYRPGMNKAAQILFMFLQSLDADAKDLISLLNTGIPSKHSNSYRKATPECFYFYLQLQGYLLGVSDVVGLLQALSPAKNDMAFSFTFRDMLREWNKPELASFIQQNIAYDGTLAGCLEILKK